MTKKILFVGSYPNPVNKYLRVFFRNLVEAAADKGYDCYVIAPVSVTNYRLNIKRIPKKTEESTENGARIHVYHPRFISYSAKKLGSIRTGVWSERAFENAAIRMADTLCGRIQFDFVYGHFFLTGGLAAIRIGRKHRLPAFVAFGECDYASQIQKPFGDLRERDISGLSGVISVSAKNTAELRSLPLFRDTRILTAPNATDLSLFYPMDRNEARKALSIDAEKFVVGFVGGFIERKGDKRLLEAVERIPGVYAAFAGTGNQPPAGDKVVFCDRLPHERVPQFLNAIDVFCLPTLSEGSCNAIVEAGACGIPIISSDLPFNDDLLNAENSIRIDPQAVDEIERAIRMLYEDRALREKLSRKIHQATRAFSIENRTDNILRFVYSVISEMQDGTAKL